MKGDTIYLHVMKNPRGKNGMPAEKKLVVSPVPGKVTAVTWMNTGRSVSFSQSGDKVTIDAAAVTPDPVDTIFKLQWK